MYAASILLLTCFECVNISLEYTFRTCALKILSIQNRSPQKGTSDTFVKMDRKSVLPPLLKQPGYLGSILHCGKKKKKRKKRKPFGPKLKTSGGMADKCGWNISFPGRSRRWARRKRPPWIKSQMLQFRLLSLLLFCQISECRPSDLYAEMFWVSFPLKTSP